MNNPFYPEPHIHKKWIIEELKRLDPKTILDTACGNGMGLYFYRQEFPSVEMTGIDIVDPMHKEYMLYHHNVMLYTGDIRKMEFPDDRFDVVICDSVFNTLYGDFEEAVKECKRVAKKHVLLLEHHNETTIDRTHDFTKLFPGVKFIRNCKEYGDPYWEEYGKLMLWSKDVN